MFDVGWSELLLIGVIVLFAFGPEDIPKIMYNLGRIMRRFRYMRFALSSQFDDFMEKAEAQGRREAESAKQKTGQPAEPARIDTEADDDEFLMEMMPLPPEKNAQTLPPIDHAPEDAQKTDDRPDDTKPV